MASAGLSSWEVRVLAKTLFASDEHQRWSWVWREILFVGALWPCNIEEKAWSYRADAASSIQYSLVKESIQVALRVGRSPYANDKEKELVASSKWCEWTSSWQSGRECKRSSGTDQQTPVILFLVLTFSGYCRAECGWQSLGDNWRADVTARVSLSVCSCTRA